MNEEQFKQLLDALHDLAYQVEEASNGLSAIADELAEIKSRLPEAGES